jgi:hypothetical protein|nr:MAG TPA: hypothetical protein [Caudoviricetes sp.]
MNKTYPTPEEQISFLVEEILTEDKVEQFNKYLSNYENKD